MFLDYEPGDFVINPNDKSWGIGQIQSIIKNKVTVSFENVGKSKEFVNDYFGGMINAFRYGAPPHAGIAPGIDRLVMLLANAHNIREVILFPMNQGAEDLMMEAPSSVSHEQLRELGLRILPRN